VRDSRTARLGFFCAHLLAHTVVCRNRYAFLDTPVDVVSTGAPIRQSAIKALCALLIGTSALWLIDEGVQLRGSLSAGNDDIVARVKSEPLAVAKEAFGEYFGDLFNWIDLSSIVVSIVAMANALHDAPDLFGADIASGPSLMAVANLLCWARLFDAVRGVDGLAFYPYLLTEVFKDLVGFFVILIAVIIMFTVSLQTLAQPMEAILDGVNGSDATTESTAHVMQFFPTAFFKVRARCPLHSLPSRISNTSTY
jgi:hypothetical protein